MLTLEKALTLWLSEVEIGLARSTFRGYSFFAGAFLHSLGHDRALAAISYEDALAWIKMRHETCKPSTVRVSMSRANVFFRWAIKRGYIRENPFTGIPLPKVEAGGDERASSLEDRNKLLRYTYYTSARNFAIVMFLSSTLCRLSAVARLRIKDIDLKNRRALLIEKGSRQVQVAFNKNTGIAIRRYLDVRPKPSPEHGYVWINSHSPERLPLKNFGIAAMLRTQSEKAGCSKNVNAHSFRHAGAQAWSLNPDVAPVDTQNKLNHKSFRSTQIYYANNSQRVGELTDSMTVLPEDLLADLQEASQDIPPTNILKFPFSG